MWETAHCERLPRVDEMGGIEVGMVTALAVGRQRRPAAVARMDLCY